MVRKGGRLSQAELPPDKLRRLFRAVAVEGTGVVRPVFHDVYNALMMRRARHLLATVPQ